MKAYLDIETSYSNRITVVGIYIANKKQLVQIVGESITPDSLMACLEDVSSIYTYNGERFDLPVIYQNLGLDLRERFKSCDLMYKCWEKNLKGGLKAVEKKLGIARTIFGKDEDDPRLLWRRYRIHRDLESLERLLDYNKQDTINLLHLEQCLENGCKLYSDQDMQVCIEDYLRLI